ncbi:hypothetical protein [Luteococcus peritonei]|uniref:PepSY domain-containing protein n=1 Tax=Luteococcus peritonei TaxID=88874 RepID=A0ABW4RUL3_9ACTN
MPDKQRAASLASVAIAGLVVAAGAGAAITANAETATPGNGSSYGSPTRTGGGQNGEQGQGGEQGDRGPGGRGDHTEATAEQTQQVTAAVKAKDSAATVEKVMVDSDGSYDAMATKNGNRTMFEVSKDLKTVTERTGGPGRDGGKGGFSDATTDQTAKVTAAVKAKDSGVTVEKVGQHEDGSFVAMGTKSGQRVAFRVSADYKTVTADQGRGGRGGHGNHTEATAQQVQQVTAAVKAKDSAATVEKVMVDSDGSYDAMATKNGNRTRFEVSKDLKTVTERQTPQR